MSPRRRLPDRQPHCHEAKFEPKLQCGGLVNSGRPPVATLPQHKRSMLRAGWSRMY